MLDMLTDKVLPVTEHADGWYVTLEGDVYSSPVKLSVLVACVFKHVRLPASVMNKLDVLHIDGDNFNIKPGNLVWKFPDGGLEVPDWPGYVYIPGFTRYAVKRDNTEMISLMSGERLLGAMRENGYIYVGVSRDDQVYLDIPEHRLFALATLPYGRDVCKLQVNHKDANRANNSPSNLEWTTVSDNMKHAFKHGYNQFAKNDSAGIKVKLRNFKTGEEFHFDTVEECAKFVGSSQAAVMFHINRLNPKKPSVLQGCYFVVRETDDFPELPLRYLTEHTSGPPAKVLAKHVDSGELLEYPSVRELLRQKPELSKKAVYTSLKRKRQRVFDGWIYKYKIDPTEWIS